MRCRWLLPVFFLIVGPLSMAACGAEPTLSPGEARTGWSFLFDGKTLDGWNGFRIAGVPEGWVINEGVLCGDSPKVELITGKKFEYFELSLEYQAAEGARGGLLFRVNESGDTAGQLAPEILLTDDAASSQSAAWLNELIPAGKRWPDGKDPVNSDRGTGQWNQLQLLVSKDVCEVNLNGVRYYQFNLGSEAWKQKVADSRFAKQADFATAESGPICLSVSAGKICFRNIKLRELPADGVAPDPVDGTLAVKVEPAFPNLKWAGWEPVNDDGLNEPFRPIVITHAGEGSKQMIVAEQRGTIYAFENDQNATESKILLNIRDRVRYADKENEEGLLGLAVHPHFQENGELYVYYTPQTKPREAIISRFRVNQAKSDDAAASTEEVLLRIPQPFWNHNGGTIEFGPDGYLYVGLGDGGSANDPHANGQNLETLLGSILRIDINKKSGDLPYAIPADNPFVDQKGACPEIYAYGFRNVWRLAFDRETKQLWAADVGQNLWEEINLVERGGNYGWSFREGLHAFGGKQPSETVKLIDPVWEYDHQVGKSITGGNVYRGQRVPELAGKYLYADYVTGKIWALDYDSKAEKVLGNYRVESPMMPIITFGEDDAGEVYFAIVANNGKGLYRFAPK